MKVSPYLGRGRRWLRPAPGPVGLALVLLASLAIAACGGSGRPAPTAVLPTSTTAPAPTASPTASPDLLDPNPSGERALEHVRALAVDIGVRPAGTPQELEAARYISDRLRSYGYSVAEQTFPFEFEAGREVGLERTSPSPGPIEAMAFTGSPAGGVSGSLAFVGLGRPEDMPPEGLQGRVALIERGQLFFSDKVANAANAGAAAVVISNNQPGLFAGNLSGPGAIPAVSISQEEGAALRTLLDQGPVEVSLDVGPPVQRTGHNVIARPTPGAACQTVSGGHYDTTPMGPGANDNASGTASVLELARVVKARGLSGSHCFVLFGAEEVGLVGSRAFVDSLSEAERRALKGMLNFDVVSDGETLELIGSPDLVQVATTVAQSSGISVVPGQDTPGTGSDHQNFISAGVPAVFFIRTGGDFLSNIIHTPQDVIDVVRPADLEEVVVIGARVLAALEQEE